LGSSSALRRDAAPAILQKPDRMVSF
jgi:hypothetical protein